MEKILELRVSIIIRTLNEEHNILACLDALKKQTILPTEVVIVDNESTDKTIERVLSVKDELPFSLRILVNTVRGYSTGLNLGIENSDCDWIGFLSADCFPEPDWLRGLLSVAADERLNCSAVQGREIPKGDSEVMFVLSEMTKKEISGVKKITYFSNTNILYNYHTLVKMHPFVGLKSDGGGEDTLMSIRYDQMGLNAYQNNESCVYHRVYDSLEDFRNRTLKHGAVILPMFIMFPLRPRLYLNSFYWSILEIARGLISLKWVYIKIGILRTYYSILGILSRYE